MPIANRPDVSRQWTEIELRELIAEMIRQNAPIDIQRFGARKA